MPCVRLTLFGPFQLEIDGRPSRGPHPRKSKALLARLALPPGRRHTRDRLAALLWSGDERARRTSLRQCLAALRKALPHGDGSAIPGDAETLYLLEAEFEIDVALFESLCDEGSTDSLMAAVALYRGELLEGFSTGENGFDDWLDTERSRLAERAHGARATLLGRHSACGDHDQAIALAIDLLADDPLQEPVHRALMQSYAALGRRQSVTDQFERCRAALCDELGIEPETKTRRLYRDLMSQSPANTSVGSVSLVTRPVPSRQVDMDPEREHPGRRATLPTRPVMLIGVAIAAAIVMVALLRPIVPEAARVPGLDESPSIRPGVDAESTERLDSAEVVRSVLPTGGQELADGLLARALEFSPVTTRRELLIARGYVERALLADPDRARAHAELALSYGQEIMFRLGEATGEAITDGLAAAHRAEALDDTLVEAALAEAMLLLAMGNHAPAMRAARRALSRAPDRADAHVALAQVLLHGGSPDTALVHVAAARRLSPNGPTSQFPVSWSYVEAHAYFVGGRYMRASALLARVLALEPELQVGHVLQAASLGKLGRSAEAASVVATIRSRDPDFSIAIDVAEALYRDRDDFERYRDGLERAGLPG